MDIQVMTPSPAASTNATPYTTAPSSPHRFPNFFYSAPTSPIHALVNFHQHDSDSDFAFNFTQPPSISAADELFHAGQIKPLKPISNNHYPPQKNTQIPNSFSDAFSQTPGEHTQNSFRISDILSDEEANHKNSPSWYSKFNLKNLILFRSASEGSARRSKEPVVKYSRIMKGDGCRTVVGGRKVSAHEMHYTANRAVAEEMRRKTYLPYKSGLFGCLGLHNNGAGSVHQISRGIDSVIKQR
ncbi:uncharacterized protein LOC143588417 [Bidens hawaiensis]|uniref:uncharacterized protein LOC143588417 n=1 Tax=Bidens hawaiensis TaxID=980011 RepID=UPI00404AE0EA